MISGMSKDVGDVPLKSKEREEQKRMRMKENRKLWFKWYFYLTFLLTSSILWITLGMVWMWGMVHQRGELLFLIDTYKEGWPETIGFLILGIGGIVISMSQVERLFRE